MQNCCRREIKYSRQRDNGKLVKVPERVVGEAAGRAAFLGLEQRYYFLRESRMNVVRECGDDRGGKSSSHHSRLVNTVTRSNKCSLEPE